MIPSPLVPFHFPLRSIEPSEQITSVFGKLIPNTFHSDTEPLKYMDCKLSLFLNASEEISVTLPDILRVKSPLQEANASDPMDTAVSGTTNVSRAVFLKALSPILVILSDLKHTLANAVHPENNSSGISEIAAGNVISVSRTQFENAPAPIDFKLFGRVIESNEEHELNAPVPIDFKLFGRVIEGNEEHELNASEPIVSIVSGNTICFNSVQCEKALFPICFTEFGIEISSRCSQYTKE